jgi:hypothetical protein
MRKIPTNFLATPRKAELPLDLSGPHVTPAPHRSIGSTRRFATPSSADW